MDIEQNTDSKSLTSGEVAELFNAYINNSASICVLSYFAEKVIDPDAGFIIKLALHTSKKRLEEIKNIFKTVNHPVPKGFSEADVNINAKKLYSDAFMLMFIRFMARFGLTNYGEARSSSSNSHVRDFLNKSINSTMELFDLADDVLLNKGLYTKTPFIPKPNSIDFVKKQSFLHGFLGEKRPLNASEINRLYLNFQRNSLGKVFLTGLSQTTSTKDIGEYLIRGVETSNKHMEVVADILKKDNLPIPMTLDTELTGSTEQVFSDKLVVFHVAALDALGLATSGISLSRVMRRDVSLAITRLMSEIALYAEDGINIMIDNEWFERIPEAADREKLIGN